VGKVALLATVHHRNQSDKQAVRGNGLMTGKALSLELFSVGSEPENLSLRLVLTA
jgi:hypothetical protein